MVRNPLSVLSEVYFLAHPEDIAHALRAHLPLDVLALQEVGSLEHLDHLAAALDMRVAGDKTYAEQCAEFRTALTEHGLQYKIDESGASIGRRYARADELGIPFAVTFDFDTVGKGEKPALKDTVTLRERDSSGQVRVPLSEAAGILAKLAGASSLKFADLAAMYGDAAGAADADGVAGMMAYLRAHNITPKLNAAALELPVRLVELEPEPQL